MWVSSQQLARAAADRDRGITRVVNKAAEAKRAKRIAELAKARKKGATK